MAKSFMNKNDMAGLLMQSGAVAGALTAANSYHLDFSKTVLAVLVAQFLTAVLKKWLEKRFPGMIGTPASMIAVKPEAAALQG